MLNISKCKDFKTSLGNLCWCSVILPEERCFLMFRLCFSISVCAETQPVSVCVCCFLSCPGYYWEEPGPSLDPLGVKGVLFALSLQVHIHFDPPEPSLLQAESLIFLSLSIQESCHSPFIPLWPFDGLYPISPCLSCNGKLRINTMAGVSSPVLSRGRGSPHLPSLWWGHFASWVVLFSSCWFWSSQSRSSTLCSRGLGCAELAESTSCSF